VLSTAVADVKRLEAMGNRSLDRISRYSYQRDIDGLIDAARWTLRQSRCDDPAANLPTMSFHQNDSEATL
jgi:hypothetical protein